MDRDEGPQPAAPASTDPYAPAQIARLVEDIGVAKARLGLVPLLTLAMLAGAFIAFGAMSYTVVTTESPFGFGPTRLLGGLAFSLGLILVLVGGAELFTGNNLLAMAWADRKITTAEVMRNWGLVYLGNLVGSLGAVFLAWQAGLHELGGGAVGRTAAAIAQDKASMEFSTAFFRGILCNALVCLAVWLSLAPRNVSGRILAIVFPISAFVALGFEHSVANMYLIPIGYLAAGEGSGLLPMTINLVPVTLGNIIGGSVFVALVYWLVYIRGG